jgi:iron complex outermembrane receptor protein
VQLSDLLKPAAGHILRLGAEYRSNRVDGSAYDADQLGLDIYAADALWIWQITPDLSLTNSARFDHAAYSFSGPVNSALLYGAQDYNRAPISELSYNSAIVYALTGLDQLRLTTARGAQIPDFYSSFPQPLNSVPYYVAGAVDAFEGSPKVKPSLITNYEADWDRAVPALLSKGRLALFYQVSRDVIGLPGDVPANNFPNAALAAITGDQGVIGYAGNLGRSESWGTELSLKGASGDWRWTAGYAAAFIRDHFPTNVSLASPDSSTDYQHGNPRHAAIAALGRSWERWEADLFGRWRSSFDDITIGSSAASYTAYHIKSNVTLDGRLAYRPIDALTLAVSGEQLNRAGLQTSSGTLSERRVFGTVSVKF